NYARDMEARAVAGIEHDPPCRRLVETRTHLNPCGAFPAQDLGALLRQPPAPSVDSSTGTVVRGEGRGAIAFVSVRAVIDKHAKWQIDPRGSIPTLEPVSIREVRRGVARGVQRGARAV